MPSLSLYFKVHQPFQLRHYGPGDIDVSHHYEDEEAERNIISRLADECYLPANSIIYSGINKSGGKFKISYSMSGTVLELLLKYRPDVIASFKEIIDTGCAEILAETYYHSLSYLYSKREFERQVRMHSSFIRKIFTIEPVILRNTELIYNTELAVVASGLGFKGILCEGSDNILKGRSPNYLYGAPGVDDIKLLLRNVELSDDIAFRFDIPAWNEHPLTAEKFAGWLHGHPEGIDNINVLLDYETFGIHKKTDSGVFDFLEALPGAVLENREWKFSIPSEIIFEKPVADIFDVKEFASWENKSGIAHPWDGNMMQHNTLRKIYSLENMLLKWGDEKAFDIWGKLQASDYFYYMADTRDKGQSYKYVNPFQSARDVYNYYTNIVFDFEISLIKRSIEDKKKRYMTHST